MTEGEVCLDYAEMAETQRQTQLDRASAVQNPLFKRNRYLWLHNEARSAIVVAEFRGHLGNVGLCSAILQYPASGLVARPWDDFRPSSVSLALRSSPSFVPCRRETLQS